MMPIIIAEIGPVEQALLFLIAALVLTLVIMLGIFLKLFNRYLDLLDAGRQIRPSAAPNPAPVMAAPVVQAAPVMPTITPPPPVTALPPVTAGEIEDGELVAVIAAAAASVLDQPHRIVAVHPVSQVQWPAINPWAIEGRVSIFSGRRVR